MMSLSTADARALLHGFAHVDDTDTETLMPDALTMKLLLLVVDELIERVEELEAYVHVQTCRLYPSQA